MGEKLNGAVPIVTGLTGVAGLIDLIPDNITKVACLIGICWTLVLIFTVIRKSISDRKKSKSDAEIAELTIEKLKIEVGKK